MVARTARGVGVAGMLGILAVAGLAAAEPKPKDVDIKPFRDQLVVLKDADGGIYVVGFERGDEPHIFYGSTKLLHEQVLEGSRSRNGDAWSVSIQAPRVEYPFMGQVEKLKDGSFRKVCGEKRTAGLTEVTGDKANAILDNAKFMTSQVIRRAYLLARDDRGIYYYVDVVRGQYGGNGHRVFVGKKGAMKQLPLTDVASDTAGDVFSTKNGELRLVRKYEPAGHTEKTTAQWIRGEKRSDLIWLDTYMNQPLIFRDLGIYKISGALCDNI